MADIPSTACLDWADRLKAGKSIIPAPIFPEQAAVAVEVFKQLRIVDAPGSPTFGEACAQWVFDFVGAVFGAYDAESGKRLIKEAFLLIPKKNSKSTIAAGIMVTALILNWRQSAELIILAPTIEIASNAFAPARDMVKADDELSELIQVQDHIRTLTNRSTGATLKVVAADNDTVGGKKASWVLIDEEWIFGKRINSENMFREAMGGLASRPEGIVIKLSTQSDEPPAGIFKQDLEYARNVRDGVIDDRRFLPVIYEYPAAMVDNKSYLDASTYGIVNPNLNFSVDLDFIERELTKALTAGEDSLRGFLAKHANVEIGLNLRSDRWAGADFWEAAAMPGLTLDFLLSRCEVAVVGIDGGGLDDMLGLAVLGREKETGKWLLWAHAWVHEIALERRKEIAPRLQDFRKEGDLTIVARPGDDVMGVADIIDRVRAAGLLPEKHGIGVDAAGIGDVVEELVRREFSAEPDRDIVAISQGWRLNAAIKTTERRVAGKELRHAGRPMMNWCVSNAKVEERGNAILITKAASGKAKIDPLMAAFSAVSLMALNPEATVAPEIYVLDM